MKKKICSIIAIFAIVAVMVTSLVGCSAKINLVDILGKDGYENLIEALSYKANYSFKESSLYKNNNVSSVQHITGGLYEVQDSTTGGVGLYNVVTDTFVSAPANNCSIETLDVGITFAVVSHTTEASSQSIYNIFLPNGVKVCDEFTADSNTLDIGVTLMPFYEINGIIGSTYYTVKIVYQENGEAKSITKNIECDMNDNYATMEMQYEFATSGDKIGKENNKHNEELAKRLGLPKGYSVAIVDNSIYTTKKNTVKSVFRLGSYDNATILSIDKGYIVYCEETQWSYECEDFDYIKDGEKFSQNIKSFNMKTGAIKNIKFDYAILDVNEIGNKAIIQAAKINKDKTLDAYINTFVVGGNGKMTKVEGLSPFDGSIQLIAKDTFLWVSSDLAYITDKYLNPKVNLSAYTFDQMDVDLANKVIYIGQTIYGETRYGAINFKGKVVLDFKYSDDLITSKSAGKRFAKNEENGEKVVISEAETPTEQAFNNFGYGAAAQVNMEYAEYGIAIVSAIAGDTTTYNLINTATFQTMTTLNSASISVDSMANGCIVKCTAADGTQKIFVRTRTFSK